ncbi:MAG: hypothetical protein AAGH53_11405 [Pseudomonadota bacterium]
MKQEKFEVGSQAWIDEFRRVAQGLCEEALAVGTLSKDESFRLVESYYDTPAHIAPDGVVTISVTLENGTIEVTEEAIDAPNMNIRGAYPVITQLAKLKHDGGMMPSADAQAIMRKACALRQLIIIGPDVPKPVALLPMHDLMAERSQ